MTNSPLIKSYKNIYYGTNSGITLINPTRDLSGSSSYSSETTFDNLRQEWYRNAVTKTPVDVIFWFDASLSMIQDDRILLSIRAVNTVIQSLSREDRFSIVASSFNGTYVDEKDSIWSFTADTDEHSPMNCLKNQLNYATEDVKKYTDFLLKSNLIRHMDLTTALSSPAAPKLFEVAVDKIDSIFTSSKTTDNQKMIIFVTDTKTYKNHNKLQAKVANMQSKFDYQIGFSTFIFDEKSQYLSKLVNQEYDTWHNNSHAVKGFSILLNHSKNPFKVLDLVEQFQTFYFQEEKQRC